MPKNVPVLAVCDEQYLPLYAQPGDAGADLRSRESKVIPAGGRNLIQTGLSIALPDGYVGLVHPRSGLAAKFGITVLNTPGTIDSGYRGEIAVTLYNTSQDDFKVEPGDRIAQLIIQKYEVADFIRVEILPNSHRGESGFGSTGKK